MPGNRAPVNTQDRSDPGTSPRIRNVPRKETNFGVIRERNL